MVKTTSIFVCQQCGYQSPQFLGRCPECGTWNSLVEEVEESRKSHPRQGSSRQVKNEIINLVDIKNEHFQRLSTGIGEFDRVLGGGIVAGSVVLVAGDPGIGKSTLLLQLALNIQCIDHSVERIIERQKKQKTNQTTSYTLKTNPCLYIAGEESAHQIKIRATRIDESANLPVLNEVDVDIITQVIESAKPSLVIVDSIQTLQTNNLESAAGSVGQVRECAHRLQRVAKNLHIPIILVGHVTKEGTVAGPKTLEHLVDVVLSLEGDSAGQFRILRGDKNRFGPTSEVGIFEMEEKGMVEVKNPSKVFLDQKINAPGSTVIPIITGLRAILVEVQALVTKTNLAIPRRVGAGVDNNRLQLLVAVISKRLGLSLFDQDVFVNITGGIKVNEPAADLGICMAIVSSLKDKQIDPKSVFIGEVGLLGEIRMVRDIEKRANEAKKLGYTNVISSKQVKSLNEVVKKMLA